MIGEKNIIAKVCLIHALLAHSDRAAALREETDPKKMKRILKRKNSSQAIFWKWNRGYSLLAHKIGLIHYLDSRC